MPEEGCDPFDKPTEELYFSGALKDRFNNLYEDSKEDRILKAVNQIKDRLDVIEGKVSQGLVLINGIWR